MIWVLVDKTTGKPLSRAEGGTRAYLYEANAWRALKLLRYGRGKNATVVAAIYGFPPVGPDDD